MPATGGVPRQLTFYPARGPLTPRWGYDNQVYGWTPDGKAVLFRSLRDGWDADRHAPLHGAVDGRACRAAADADSGAGDLSPDGKQVVYSPLSRDFRTWKRYQGGWAQDLYIFDLADARRDAASPTHPRTERDPMWIGDTIYFDSDRDGTLNLYAYDLGEQATTQLTTSTTWDVRWPSADERRRASSTSWTASCSVFDTKRGEGARDRDHRARRRRWRRGPRASRRRSRSRTSTLSPKGERALFVARGDVFTAPIEKGPTRNLTHSSGAHDKWARWSPDGTKIAFISDASGEEELYLVAQDGSASRSSSRSGGKAMRYAPDWSPDGKRLAFGDKDGKLYVLTRRRRRS